MGFSHLMYSPLVVPFTPVYYTPTPIILDLCHRDGVRLLPSVMVELGRHVIVDLENGEDMDMMTGRRDGR